ncbi:hypothetical protein R3P38DRAFT_2526430, partial [Favolaschia claudopus]
LLHIHGHSIRSVAACILDLVKFLDCRTDPAAVFKMDGDNQHQEEIVRCDAEDFSLSSFLRPCRNILIGVRQNTARRAVTSGVGPERAAMRLAATLLSEKHHHWQQVPSSQMFRPVLSPTVIPERINTFRAHGIFLALHCYLLQHGPHPISIWLLLSFICGKDTMLIPKHILEYMDPGVAKLLAAWYEFLPDSPVPPASDHSHPLRLFILEHWIPAIQPNLISDVRTPEEHKAWIITAFSIILFGHPDPWNHPEYLALREGFNKAFGRLRFNESLRSLRASAFLVAIYDRRVHRIEEVQDHLSYSVTSRHSDLTTPYLVKLFRLRVEEYLQGAGHPVELRDRIKAFGIPDEQFIATQGDPLLRANLLLRCGSDSDMRPTEDNWNLSFNFRGRSVSRLNVPEPLAFHTCFYSIEVDLNDGLRQLLLDPVVSVHGVSSRFTLWIHEQMVDPDHNAT